MTKKRHPEINASDVLILERDQCINALKIVMQAPTLKVAQEIAEAVLVRLDAN